MNIVIRKQSVNIGAANVLFVKVEHRYIRIILKYHARNNLIAYRQWLACAVRFYIFAHFYDLACSLVTEHNRNKTERIAFEFMSVRTADSAAFHFYKYIAVSEFRYRKFFYIEIFRLCKHRNMSRFRYIAR